ncbi:ras GEF [Gonapodya prolifera JEL478]|uniref:Ras GEF n=1 Tax=Gonapodya prolifera (strain JEL478) TaxID=1344416 RepID=A0A139AQG7_GONPJ|nr:ras GEF [Gonapodya prolifera JEL478]|eukprot:KXS18962.1 ras GEF [Gonapodya prolifera JEL478]
MLSARLLAEQLTLVDIHLFRAIKSSEFSIYLWGRSEERSIRSRHLLEYIERFNQVGFWAATIVLTQSHAKDRARAIEKLVRVAKHCVRLHNFNSAMAILSGLTMAPVNRLKKTWLCVPTRAMAELSELEELFRYSSNFKSYRHLEHTATPPMLPFFGLFIKDLVFMNDGNQRSLPTLGDMDGSASTSSRSGISTSYSSTPNEKVHGDQPQTKPEPLFNFEKASLVHGKVATVHFLQKHTYSFTPDVTPIPNRGMAPTPSPSSTPSTAIHLLAMPTVRAVTRRASAAPVSRGSGSFPVPDGRRRSIANSEISPTSSVAAAGDSTADALGPRVSLDSHNTVATASGPVVTMYEYCRGLPTLDEKTLDRISRELEAPPPAANRGVAPSGGSGATLIVPSFAAAGDGGTSAVDPNKVEYNSVERVVAAS